MLLVLYTEVSVPTDPTESVYLALWNCHSRIYDMFLNYVTSFTCLGCCFVLTQQDIYTMHNHSSVWRDAFNVQVSGVFSRKIVCRSSTLL